MRTLAAVLSTCAAACGIWNPFVPDVRSPADRAREMMPRCTDEEMDADVFRPAHIEEVKPLLSRVPSGNDRAIRLLGSELHLHPISSLSAEGLQRKLECHEARVVAGREAPLPEDPYVLDGAWLDVKVRSDGDAFLVTVQTDDLVQAKAVLERARRYVARPAEPTPSPPPKTAEVAP